MTHRLSNAFLLIVIAITLPALAQTQAPAQAQPDCNEIQKQLKNLENRLKDWPNLGRYREDNSKVQPPSKDINRVVFMGDSITDFWVRSEMGGFFPGKPYIDRGISGQTTAQMLLRFRPDVIALDPKVVVILAGTNDISGNTGPSTTEQIEGNLMSMIELAQSHGIKLVLATLLPVSDYEHKADGTPIVQTVRRPPEKIKALNEWMRKYASTGKIVLLDYYSAMVDEKGFLKDELSQDGLHPDVKGYAVMAPLAEKAIGQALKKK